MAGGDCDHTTVNGGTSGWGDYPKPQDAASSTCENWTTESGCGGDAGCQFLRGFEAECGDDMSSCCCLFTLVVRSMLGWSSWKQSVKRNPKLDAKKICSIANGWAEGEFRVEWDALPTDSQKPLRDCIERELLLCGETEELDWCESVTLTAPYFFIGGGVWQCAGYDTSLKNWRLLPPLAYLPGHCQPDSDLLKEFLVCTKDGIVCVNVSKSDEDRLMVFNLLTGRWRELPPLNHRRNPVLMHLVVNSATQSYQVIVAGSSRSGDEKLSRMTEVFDSRTWRWKRTGDLPGPDYALNDYQSGVYQNGCILCLAFLDDDMGKGILRYHLEKGEWLKHWTYAIPFARNSTILQLVESWGEVYLFSEQETAGCFEHCVDRVEWSPCSEGVSEWLNNVVRKKKAGGRSLEIYPEYTCVAYSENEVCVVSTIEHSGVIYDVRNHGRSEALQAPPADGKFGGEGFFSLNPLSFTFEPSFRSEL